MSAAINRITWSALDPLLRKLGARLARLGALRPPMDRGYLEPIARLDATATITRDATILNHANREDLTVGAYSIVCGELLIPTQSGRLSVRHHCAIGSGSPIWAHECVELATTR